jgi:hypothetical protein
MGSSPEDAKRDFLEENNPPINLEDVPLKELIEEITARPGVKVLDVQTEGQWMLAVHNSRKIVNDSTLVIREEDAGPATILEIGIVTQHSKTWIQRKIAEAIEKELYLPLKEEIERTPYTSRLGFLKERLKGKIEEILLEGGL